TGWLLQQLLTLEHSNGRPMVRIYGPTTTAMRGGTIAFNFYDPDGGLLDYRRVEELATAERISLRTGCFCNPGAGEVAEGLTEDDMLAGLEVGAEISLPRFLQVIHHRGGKSTGAIRASLGLASNFADVDSGGMDTSVAPGDDFFSYANGGWYKKTEIPADRAGVGSWSVMSDKAQDRTRDMIEGLAKPGAAKTPDDQKIGDYFTSYMDE